MGIDVLTYAILKKQIGNGGGSKGEDGKSAYDLAVDAGYTGTLDEWLSSLQGKSAYEVAVENGFSGTEDEWLDSISAEGSIGAIPIEEIEAMFN